MGAIRSKKSLKVKDSTTKKPETLCTDAIIAIKSHFVEFIAQRKKNYEYRKYKLASVQRLWLYETAPKSMITSILQQDIFVLKYISNFEQKPRYDHSTAQSVGRSPNGIGNVDFDAGKKESKYGYPVLKLHRLQKPISIVGLRKYNPKPPQGFMYVPVQLAKDYPLEKMDTLF